jgi:Flp pilus assembly protein TadD
LGEQQVLAAEKPNTQRIAISHNGQFIATAEGQTVSVWDRRGPGAPVGHVLRGHEQTVAKLAMSPEGSWLATASHDGEVKIWDLRDEELQDSTITLSAKQEGGQQAVFQELLFSPDGRWLGASTYHALYFWDLDPAGLLDEARRLAGRELSSDELARFRLNTPDRQRERLLRQAHEFTKQLDAKPTDVELLRRRADLLAAAGSFQEAIDDLRLISRLRPDDHWPQYNLLSLYAQTGQREAYRAECERLASQFGKTDQLEILERIAKGALFWAESGNDWNIVAARADRALEQAIENKHWVVAWAEIAKGLAEYRVGNYAAAVEWAQKGLSHGTANAYSIGVPGNQVRALALAQLGRLDEARSALAEARTVHASFPSPLAGWTSGWHDWYMAEIMFHEIDALLIEKLPPPMAATDVDLDGD